jgi:hypothetical protein
MKFILAALITLMAAALWWHGGSLQQGREVSQTSPEPALDLEALDLDTVEQQQAAALQAALAWPNEPALTGPISRRPAFVSPVEWQVLNAVARQRPDSEQELTRMVNYLRFSKQLEAWQMPPETMTPDQHQQLGWQLLNAIPLRVIAQDLAPHHAQTLQMTLLETLVTDPSDRRQHLQEQAQRIGVTFDIHDNG